MKKSQVALAVVSNDEVSTLDNLAIVSAIGVNLGKIVKLDGEIKTLKDDINQKIVVLFNRKIVVGRYSKEGATKGCAYACAFVDVCVQSGIEQSTAQRVYLPTFKDAVATGKPVDDWNKSRADAKNKKGSANTTKEKQALASKLNKAYKDAEFDGFIADLQKSFLDDEIKTLKEGIESFLEMNGIEIKTEKK
jgi:hypothetical protein